MYKMDWQSVAVLWLADRAFSIMTVLTPGSNNMLLGPYKVRKCVHALTRGWRLSTGGRGLARLTSAEGEHARDLDQGLVSSPLVIHSIEEHGGEHPNILSLIQTVEPSALYRAARESVMIAKQTQGPTNLNRCTEWGAPGSWSSQWQEEMLQRASRTRPAQPQHPVNKGGDATNWEWHNKNSCSVDPGPGSTNARSSSRDQQETKVDPGAGDSPGGRPQQPQGWEKWERSQPCLDNNTPPPTPLPQLLLLQLIHPDLGAAPCHAGLWSPPLALT